MSSSGQKKKKAAGVESDQSSSSEEDGQPKEDHGDATNDDIYYYSKPDKQYKVFDPKGKTWSMQTTKPTEDQVSALRTTQEEVKQSEKKIIDEIRHDIAGESDSEDLPKMSRRESNAGDAIANEAAQQVLKKISSSGQ